jgi:hypothetical protein
MRDISSRPTLELYYLNPLLHLSVLPPSPPPPPPPRKRPWTSHHLERGGATVHASKPSGSCVHTRGRGHPRSTKCLLEGLR